MTAQKGEREEALSEFDSDALIITWERNPNLLGFRDAVLSCLRELKASRAALLSSSAAEGEMPTAESVDCAYREAQGDYKIVAIYRDPQDADTALKLLKEPK